MTLLSDSSARITFKMRLGQDLPLVKMWWKSTHNCLRAAAHCHRHTTCQTNGRTWSHKLRLGGGNKCIGLSISAVSWYEHLLIFLFVLLKHKLLYYSIQHCCRAVLSIIAACHGSVAGCPSSTFVGLYCLETAKHKLFSYFIQCVHEKQSQLLFTF